MLNHRKRIINTIQQALSIHCNRLRLPLSSNIQNISSRKAIQITFKLQSQRQRPHRIILYSKLLAICFKKLLSRSHTIKYLWIVSIYRNRSILRCHNERKSILTKVTLSWNQLELRMQYVVTPLLKSIHHTTDEYIEQQYISISLADQQNVRIVRVSIHCTDSSILLTHVSAHLSSYPTLLDTVN
jgi:hypothetical protein